MAKCTEISGKDDIALSLEGVEVEFLELHAKTFGMGFDDSVADIVEYGILKMGETFVGPNTIDEDPNVAMDAQVTITINYPTSGPFSVFTAKDRAFLGAMMNVSLREAITIMVYQHMGKVSPNELGKES